MRKDPLVLLCTLVITTALFFFDVSLEADGWVQFKALNGRPGRKEEIRDWWREGGKLYVLPSFAKVAHSILPWDVFEMVFDEKTIISNRPSSSRRPAPSYRIPSRISQVILDDDLKSLINEKSVEYDVRSALVHAIIQVESGGNPNLVSPKGAMGLMQLMPATAGDLGVRNPFDPRENVDGGTRHLRQLLDALRGNERLTLAAYHGGLRDVERCRCIPLKHDGNITTQQYVDMVMGVTNSSPP